MSGYTEGNNVWGLLHKDGFLYITVMDECPRFWKTREAARDRKRLLKRLYPKDWMKHYKVVKVTLEYHIEE